MLRKLHETERVSIREGWLENVVSAVFAVQGQVSDDHLMESMDAADLSSAAKIPDIQALKAEVEKEMNEETEKKLQKCKLCMEVEFFMEKDIGRDWNQATVVKKKYANCEVGKIV